MEDRFLPFQKTQPCYFELKAPENGASKCDDKTQVP